MNMHDVLAARGTYAAVRYDRHSVHLLEAYCIKNAVPKHRATIDRLHTTVLYSRKYLPECTHVEFLQQLAPTAVTSHLDIWKTNESMKGDMPPANALVVVLESPMLEYLHKDLMNYHCGEYDFPTYIPHISLSYNIGNLTLDDFAPISKLNLRVSHLYVEDLML